MITFSESTQMFSDPNDILTISNSSDTNSSNSIDRVTG